MSGPFRLFEQSPTQITKLLANMTSTTKDNSNLSVSTGATVLQLQGEKKMRESAARRLYLIRTYERNYEDWDMIFYFKTVDGFQVPTVELYFDFLKLSYVMPLPPDHETLSLLSPDVLKLKRSMIIKFCGETIFNQAFRYSLFGRVIDEYERLQNFEYNALMSFKFYFRQRFEFSQEIAIKASKIIHKRNFNENIKLELLECVSQSQSYANHLIGGKWEVFKNISSSKVDLKKEFAVVINELKEKNEKQKKNKKGKNKKKKNIEICNRLIRNFTICLIGDVTKLSLQDKEDVMFYVANHIGHESSNVIEMANAVVRHIDSLISSESTSLYQGRKSNLKRFDEWNYQDLNMKKLIKAVKNFLPHSQMFESLIPPIRLNEAQMEEIKDVKNLISSFNDKLTEDSLENLGRSLSKGITTPEVKSMVTSFEKSTSNIKESVEGAQGMLDSVKSMFDKLINDYFPECTAMACTALAMVILGFFYYNGYTKSALAGLICVLAIILTSYGCSSSATRLSEFLIESKVSHTQMTEDSFISLAMGVVSMSLFKGKDFNMKGFMSGVKGFANTKRDVESIFKFILKSSQEMIDWGCKQFNLPSMQLVQTDLPELNEWVMKCRDIFDRELRGEFIKTQSNAIEVNELNKQGQELLVKFSDRDLQHLREKIRPILARLVAIEMAMSSAGVFAGGLRMSSVFILLRGESKIGKTKLIRNLITRLIMECRPEHEGRLRKDMKSLIYNVNPNCKHYDGYTNQMVNVYDEMFVEKAEKCEVDNMALEAIKTKNTYEYMLSMADLTRKGNTYMTPEFMVGTSNVKNLPAYISKLVNYPTAVLNRLDLDLYCVVREEYALDLSVAPEDRELDTSKLPLDGSFDWNVLEFHHVKYEREVPRVVDVYNIEEVIYLASNLWRKYQKEAKCEAIDIDNAIDYANGIGKIKVPKIRDKFLPKTQMKITEEFMCPELRQLTYLLEDTVPYDRIQLQMRSKAYNNLDLKTMIMALRPRPGLYFNDKRCVEFLNQMDSDVLSILTQFSLEYEWFDRELTMCDMIKFLRLCYAIQTRLENGSIKPEIIEFPIRADIMEGAPLFSTIFDGFNELCKDFLVEIASYIGQWKYGRIFNAWMFEYYKVIRSYLGLVAVCLPLFFLIRIIIDVVKGLFGLVTQPFRRNEVEIPVEIETGETDLPKLINAELEMGSPGKVQMAVDHEASNIYEKLRNKNMYSLIFHGEVKGQVLMIKGDLALMNNHYYDIMQQRVSDTDTIIMEPWNSSKDKISFSKTEFFKCTKRIQDRDLMIVKLSKMKPHPDITSLFITNADLRSVGGHGFLCARRGGQNSTIGGRFRPHESTKALFSGGELRTINKTLEYSITTYDGDCGSPFLLYNARFPTKKIVGIHFAGDAGHSVAQGIVVTQEDLLELTTLPSAQMSDKPSKYLSDFDERGLKSNGSEFENFIEGSNMRLVGRLNTVLGQPSKSKIKRSCLYEAWGPCTKKKARLTPYTEGDIVVDPGFESIKKLNKPNPNIPDMWLKVCVEAVFADYRKNTSLSEPPNMKLISVEDAIYGRPGIPGFESVNRSTGMGFPWNIKPKPGWPGKTRVFGKEALHSKGPDYDEFMKNCEELQNTWRGPFCDNLEEALVKGLRGRDFLDKIFVCYSEQMIAVSCLKDETRPILNDKYKIPRNFSCFPAEHAFELTRMFGEFISHVQCHKIVSECTIGINVYGEDWNMLHRYLTSFGNNKLIAGDFSGFDTSMDRLLKYYVLQGFISFFNDDFNCYRLFLVGGIIHVYVIVRGCLVRIEPNNPSGHKLTTLINCFVNMVLYRLAWLLAHNGNVSCLEIFQLHCILRVFGDDSTLAVSDYASAFFNQETLPGLMAKFGTKYTIESKDDKECKWRSILDITFLKRSFRYEPFLGRWVAPLAKETVEQMAYWTKVDDSENITLTNFITSIFELSLYGEEYYNKMSEPMLRAFTRITGRSMYVTIWDLVIQRVEHFGKLKYKV